MKKKMLTKKIIYLLIIVTVTSCSLLKGSDRDFDKDSWLNDVDHRYEMSDDLLDNYLYIGKAESDVVNLLGESDEIDILSDSNKNRKYIMGYGSSHTYNLCIEFNINGISNYFEEKYPW